MRPTLLRLLQSLALRILDKNIRSWLRSLLYCSQCDTTQNACFHECLETKSQVPLRSARPQLALVTDLVSAEQICSFSRSRKAPSAAPAGHLEGTIIAHDINYDVSGWTPTAARQPTPWTQADAANAWMQMCVRSGTTWFLNTRLIWKKWAVSVFIGVYFIPLLLLWEVALKIQSWASGMRLRNSSEWPSNCVHPHFFFQFPKKCLNSHKQHSHLFLLSIPKQSWGTDRNIFF